MSLKRHATTRNTPFRLKKKFGGGKFKKYAKGFSGWAQHSSAVLGGAAQRLVFCAKIGSSEFKKSLHIHRDAFCVFLCYLSINMPKGGVLY